MALVPFTSFVNDIAPHVDGCPSPVIAQYIRKIFIDLCVRANVWRVPLADVVLSSPTYSYNLVSPVAETEVSMILNAQWFKASTPTVIQGLEITTEEVVHALYPDWPNTATVALGEPRVLFQYNPTQFNIAPVPGTGSTYTVKLMASIKPAVNAVNVEDSIMSTFARAWFHGTVHALMSMPGRVWTNDKLALFHGREWSTFVDSAKTKANKGFSRVPISVKMRPWA